MKIEYSKHALEQMKIRGISKSDVTKVLNNFDLSENQDIETIIFSKILIKSNKAYLYRVFVNTTKNPQFVITVYRTSKIEKYGNKI